jgi:protein involved in temperature-dependent protein secretion
LRWILDGEILTPRSIKAFLIALVCIEGSWEKIIVNLVPVLALVVPEKLCWQGDALFFRDSRSGVRLKVQRVTGSTITQFTTLAPQLTIVSKLRNSLLKCKSYAPTSCKAFLVALFCIEGAWEKVIVDFVPVFTLEIMTNELWSG